MMCPGQTRTPGRTRSAGTEHRTGEDLSAAPLDASVTEYVRWWWLGVVSPPDRLPRGERESPLRGAPVGGRFSEPTGGWVNALERV
nr:hypothetical protein [Pseudomonas syringae pv. actinidiae]